MGEQRIIDIFRYLDPGGEGTVSNPEWKILGQLWNEFELSLKEFVEFLCRIFDGLDIAWLFLDSDESGGLDEAEWCEAVEEIQYFGPAKVVFNILAKDGQITEEEFNSLNAYKPGEDVPQMTRSGTKTRSKS